MKATAAKRLEFLSDTVAMRDERAHQTRYVVVTP